MSTVKEIFSNLDFVFCKLFGHFKSVDDYLVKSDEESIDLLLKTEKDKAIFQAEVDKMILDNKKSTNININNKMVNISI